MNHNLLLREYIFVLLMMMKPGNLLWRGGYYKEQQFVTRKFYFVIFIKTPCEIIDMTYNRRKIFTLSLC